MGAAVSDAWGLLQVGQEARFVQQLGLRLREQMEAAEPHPLGRRQDIVQVKVAAFQPTLFWRVC